MSSQFFRGDVEPFGVFGFVVVENEVGFSNEFEESFVSFWGF